MFSSRNKNIYYESLDRAKLSLTSLRNTIDIKKNIESHQNTFSQNINSISYNILKDSDSRIYSEELDNKDESQLSSRNSKKICGKNDNLNIDNTIKEYITYSNNLRDKLKMNNDINQERINKYEELIQKINEIEIQNKVINQQFLDFKDENNRLKIENENLKKMIIDSSSNINIEEERNLKNIEEKYQMIIEKENFFKKVNSDLEKSNSEYDILINKLEKTFNILNSNSKKKSFKNLSINRLNSNFIIQNQEENQKIKFSEITLNNNKNNININENNKNTLYQNENSININQCNTNLSNNFDILKGKMDKNQDIQNKYEGKTSDNLNQFQQKIKINNINKTSDNDINLENIKLLNINEKKGISKNQIQELNNNFEDKNFIHNKNKNISFEQNDNQIYNKLLNSYESLQKSIESKTNNTMIEKDENFDLSIEKNRKIPFQNENKNSFNDNLKQSDNISTFLKQTIIDDSLSFYSQNKLNNSFQNLNINDPNFENNISNSNYFNKSKEKDINSNQTQFSFSRNNYNIQKKDIKNEIKKITPLNLDERFIMNSNINNGNGINSNNKDKNSKLNDLLYSDNKDKNILFNDEKEIILKDTINFEDNIKIKNNEKIGISEKKNIKNENIIEKDYAKKIVLENIKINKESNIIEKDSIINGNTKNENDFKINNKEFNNQLSQQEASPKFDKNSNILISNSINEKTKDNDNIIKKNNPFRIKSNSLKSLRPSYLKILKDISILQKKKNLKNNITIDINDIKKNLAIKTIPKNNKKIIKSQSTISSKNKSFYSESENCTSQINELIILMKQKENEIEGIKEQFKILNSNLQKNHNENCNYKEKYIKEKQINLKVILSLEQLNGLAQGLLDTRIQMQNKYENEIKRLKNKINQNPSFSPEKDNKYFIKDENNEYVFLNNNNYDNLKELEKKYNFMEIFNYEELKIENACQLILKNNIFNDTFNYDKNVIHLNSKELNKNSNINNDELNEDVIFEISIENDSINQKLESNKEEEKTLEYISEDDENSTHNKKNNINSISENKTIDFDIDSKILNYNINENIYDGNNENKYLYESIFNDSLNEKYQNTNNYNNEINCIKEDKNQEKSFNIVHNVIKI